MRDTIFSGGPIWVGGPGGVSPALPVEAVVIRDGRIAHVGSLAEAQAGARPAAHRFDLAGRALMPGFVDAHTHFLTGGRKLSCVTLRDAASRPEFTRRVEGDASARKPGSWILGGDWDHELWGGDLPDREWIDAVTPGHPVWLHRLDIHMALANSVTLRMAGIDDETPDPPGGTIVRDETGRATGVLKDAAMKLVERVMPPATREERIGWLTAAATHALSLGVTQVHDVDGWDSLNLYRSVADSGPMPLRIYAAVPTPTWPDLQALIRQNGRGDQRLWWGGLKAFVDGSLGSRTAWFHDAYPGEPTNFGLVVTDLDALAEQMMAADAEGLQCITHAIGDRANDWLLDSYESMNRLNGARDRRARVEHAQHLSASAIERFARLGVIPSMQPAHAADDGRWADRRLNADQVSRSYPIASLARSGARLAFGSDWTVAALDPLAAVEAAVTRAPTDGSRPGGWVPSERIEIETALRAHTFGSAWAGFSDAWSGSIEVGKQADLVILNRDPLSVAPTELSSLAVEYTFVDGTMMFPEVGEREVTE